MLDSIDIKNLGIIETAELEFGPGLTVLTGETGAGKTMILSSIELVRGAKAAAELVGSHAEKCEVTAEFSVADSDFDNVQPVLSQVGATWDMHGDRAILLLGRDLAKTGRSKAYLGGRPVPAGQLSLAADSLVAIHGQSDQSLLREPAAQLAVLDRAGGESLKNKRQKFQESRDVYRKLVGELERFRSERYERELRREILERELAIYNEINPLEGEDSTIETTLGVLRNSSTLAEITDLVRGDLAGETSLASASSLPSEGTNVVALLARAAKELTRAQEFDPELALMEQRVTAALNDIVDIEADLADYAGRLDSDPETLESMEQRLSAISALRKKHGPELSDTIAWAKSARAELEELTVGDDHEQQLEERIRTARSELVKHATTLTKERRSVAATVSAGVQKELAALAMPEARFVIDVNAELDADKFTATGADQVLFSIAGHKGAPLLPVSKVASGGELSRIMLALEVVLAGDQPTPTMIFDEIDAGIGGSVAVEVGKRLAKLAQQTQVIVITHLPQVAAFASCHLVVAKEQKKNRMSLTVGEVTGADRLRELTRMLSGLPDSESGVAHAQELLTMAQASS